LADLEITLPPDARSVRVAREATRQCLERFPSECAEVAAAIVSELVSNAIRHGSPPIRLLLSTQPTRITITVVDAGSAEPVVKNAAPLDQQGRGLEIVEALSDRWGVSHDKSGKAVWCELDVVPARR
jgi:anti-sigma regulatory factor (Ser/Thr protein kinase)